MRANSMAALGAALMLCGCVTTEEAASGPNAPPNYRELVLAKAKEVYFDPYSIRDASISKPFPGVSILGAIDTVCVRANAKNRMGGYTGIKPSQFVFKNGKVFSASDDDSNIVCYGATYEPFPELEAKPSKSS